MKSGLIYIFTGDGKGKTSAALGTVVRALAQGWSVSWVAFYKDARWQISEYQLPKLLKKPWADRLEMCALGQGFYITTANKTAPVQQAVVIDTKTPAQHRQAAQAALHKAEEILQRAAPPQLLVIDEVCNAIADHLITEAEVIKVLAQRQSTHCVLTGRGATPRLIEMADLVSSITKIKHPYDQGQLAVPGLDF
jgi:cob(I)alamin adenosyltransferase